MNSLLWLIIQIIQLYQFVLLIYIISTWLISFNIINTSNRFISSVMDSLYRLCEPSLRFVRQFLPNLGNIDISPVIILLLLEFIKSLLNEYWPRY
jgi:YggT family protein